MKNTVVAQVHFSFKGEDFSPSLVLPLDRYAKTNSCFTNLYPAIARANQIDMYSYAYEVMESAAIVFHSAVGDVVNYVSDGQCDLLAYQDYLIEKEMCIKLEKIAAEVLGVDDLHHNDHVLLKIALEKAYQAGD